MKHPTSKRIKNAIFGNHFSGEKELSSESYIYQKVLIDNFSNPGPCAFKKIYQISENKAHFKVLWRKTEQYNKQDKRYIKIILSCFLSFRL